MWRKVGLISLIAIIAVQFTFGFTGCTKAAQSESSAPASAPSTAEQAAPPASGAAESQPASAFGAFQAVDLEGNEVDQSVFAKADLTMVYLWATYCGPCLSGMPEMEELAQEYQDKNVKIIGVVLDVLKEDGSLSDEQAATAREAVKQTGVTYPNLLLNMDLLLNNLPFAGTTPEVFFIDKDGNYVGKHYLGKREKAEWAKIIEEKRAEVSA